MIEVFTTSVTEHREANLLIRQIEALYPGYRANFDLADCDRILRVVSGSGTVDSEGVISLLEDFGYRAGILADTIRSGFSDPEKGTDDFAVYIGPGIREGMHRDCV